MFEYKVYCLKIQHVRKVKLQVTPVINFIITKKFLVEFKSVITD